MSLRREYLAARGLCMVGMPRMLDALWGGKRLTVLAYHRIANADAPAYRQIVDNMSASPTMFERQMAYVKQHFNVIDLPACVQAVMSNKTLPDRALLITFDDGYFDNYQYAYPVLKQLGLPAVMFLITGQMGISTLPWWDAVAYCFRMTALPRAMVPLIGEQDLRTTQQRIAAWNTLLVRLKEIPEDEKIQAVSALSSALDVTPPSHEPQLFMDWGHVRELVANGIACQPHTVTHPILTRVDHQRMQQELAQSFRAIHEQTGESTAAFAYPNGTPADFNDAVQRSLRELGCKVAFTTTERWVPHTELRTHPLEIPRFCLAYRDSLDLFILKIMGWFALRPMIRGMLASNDA